MLIDLLYLTACVACAYVSDPASITKAEYQYYLGRFAARVCRRTVPLTLQRESQLLRLSTLLFLVQACVLATTILLRYK